MTVALGEYLHALGVGVWSPSGALPRDAVGITVKAMPAQPDSVIVLSPYPVTGSGASDVTLGMQIRCRAGGLPTAVDDLADHIYDALHGARNLQLGPARVALVWRASHAQMGVDGDGRWDTTSNFYLQTAHPSAHVRD
ncbi:minor capsid protein [Georgenia faecalis]|uniref:minor capsid protein n=1 Tax=Georgenia faecalis TaxID=2483799 RepID=UPI000FD897F9|nr:minor capsid protein [Georgenia faecalis]